MPPPAEELDNRIKETLVSPTSQLKNYSSQARGNELKSNGM